MKVTHTNIKDSMYLMTVWPTATILILFARHKVVAVGMRSMIPKGVCYRSGEAMS